MLKWVLAAVALLLVVLGFWLFEGDLPAAEVDGRYANEASQFLTLPSGARLHFRDQGDPTGLPVVLVHGANASLHTWEPWVDQVGDIARIVTLDLPAHGLTGRVPGDDYGPEAQRAAVAALAAHLGLGRLVIGGNSMGGGVAWRYALAHHEQVLGLILVDASPPPAWRDGGGANDQGRTPWAFRLLASPWCRAVARYVDPHVFLVRGLRAAYNDAPVVDDGLVARYRDLTLREGSRAAILARFGQPRPTASDGADPADVGVPTLILWGARDTLIPPSYGERFRDEIPDARLVTYPDLGHVPMEEAPARTAADVRAFLEALQENPRGITSGAR